MNGVCFKVSGGTSVPKLSPSYPPSLKYINSYLDFNILLIPISNSHSRQKY